MIRSKNKLEFSRYDLTEAAEDFLSQHLQTTDYRGFWCDLGALEDEGLELIQFLSICNFSPEMEKEIRAFFQANPEGEIEWR